MPVRASLYGEEFDTLVNQHGIKCKYYPAIICDCITKDSKQPLFTCPKCGGSGYRYLPPVDIRVVVTSLNNSLDEKLTGLRTSGTVYATPQPDIIMGFGDKLMFPDFKCKYSERLFVEPNGVITSKTYRNIKDVICLVHGDIEFQAGEDYEISEDFYHIELHKPIEELIGNAEVEWNEDGSLSLSILYYTTPVYLVEDLLHELRSHYTIRHVPSETFEELPKQYLLRRQDFVYDINTEVEEIDELQEPEESTGLFD